MQLLKTSNMEPIPGYKLLERLGKGGFGEVWKCEAPGGLHKAIKFVTNSDDTLHSDSSGADQELRALQHVKTIRHPFLLSMERVEVHDGELIIVMELADQSLHDVLERYRAAGQSGIPRGELLGYLRETAEVLDLMNHEYGLQHLDIKPRNLFLVAKHVKVADFGLVNSLAEMNAGKADAAKLGAITPLYASPESFLGKISLFSDQYSLAITYHELLTGALPFEGKNYRQLAMQHMAAEPNLSRLPGHDRPVLAQALAKDPALRFPSCSDFVRALEAASAPAEPGFPPGASAARIPTPHDINLGETANAGVNPSTARTGRPESMGMTLPPGAVPGFASAPVPTGNGALLGYKFLECFARGQTGELWKTQAPSGQKRLVRFVYGYDPRADQDEEGALARLRSLRHPTLAEVEIILEDTGRLTLISDPGETTLAGWLKDCQAKGMQGVPRATLLECLRLTAEVLDQLYQENLLQHLGLNPRQIVLNGDLMWIADFGLAELIWQPAGLQLAALNIRYSAPELFDNQMSRCCDQYSLALIYQEMLTGVHPFRNLNQRQMATAKLRGKPDLGMAPAVDRPILLKALSGNPDARFSTCSEFVTALETGNPGSKRVARVSPEAPSSPAAQTGPEDASEAASSVYLAKSLADSIEKIMEEVLAASEGGGQEVHEYKSFRYLLRPGKGIEYHCFARVIPGTLNMKLNAFCKQWNTKFTAKDERTLVCFLETAGNLWQRALGKVPGLELSLHLHPAKTTSATLTNITISLVPVHCGPSQSDEALKENGPELLHSLRLLLQAPPDRRAAERLPYEQTIQVIPCQNGMQVGQPLRGQTKDVSTCGLGLFLPCLLYTPEVYVQIPVRGGAETVTLLSRVVRAEPMPDGRFQVGLCFVQ
jgi:serine/threonine protein kinase